MMLASFAQARTSRTAGESMPSTTRASFYLYNDEQDVAALVAATQRALEFFG